MNLELARGKWKSARIRIHGDLYFIRRTLDLGEHGEHIYGFDVYNEEGEFVARYEGCDLAEAIQCIQTGYLPAPRLSARLFHGQT